jgi:hypothetical protein
MIHGGFSQLCSGSLGERTDPVRGSLCSKNCWNLFNFYGRIFLSYILLVLKADLHLMLDMYIQLRHPIIHYISDFYPIITR